MSWDYVSHARECVKLNLPYLIAESSTQLVSYSLHTVFSSLGKAQWWPYNYLDFTIGFIIDYIIIIIPHNHKKVNNCYWR
jgi:hypothetical protein